MDGELQVIFSTLKVNSLSISEQGWTWASPDNP